MKNKFSEHYQKVLQDFSPEQNLLIVSKTRTLEEIQAYYDLGQRHFAENRVAELLAKAAALKNTCPEISWHMIGNLQSNKVKDLFKVNHLFAIHSVDRISLLKELLKHEGELDHDLHLFLQFNTSGEIEKSGFTDLAELENGLPLIEASAHLKLRGLMTMAPLRVEDQLLGAQSSFMRLSAVRDELGKKYSLKLELSMGMSQDYLLALQCGSHWLRLGTMMFELDKSL